MSINLGISGLGKPFRQCYVCTLNAHVEDHVIMLCCFRCRDIEMLSRDRPATWYRSSGMCSARMISFSLNSDMSECGKLPNSTTSPPFPTPDRPSTCETDAHTLQTPYRAAHCPTYSQTLSIRTSSSHSRASQATIRSVCRLRPSAVRTQTVADSSRPRNHRSHDYGSSISSFSPEEEVRGQLALETTKNLQLSRAECAETAADCVTVI